jgi:hypothetical protein
MAGRFRLLHEQQIPAKITPVAGWLVVAEMGELLWFGRPLPVATQRRRRRL